MKAAELLVQAMKLDSRARAGMARQLLESLDDLSPSEIDALWVEEAERRDDAIEAGAVASIRAEDVFANIRATMR